MTDSSFYVRRLHLQRLYGIEHGIEAEPFAKGVNVVYGPNGKGKTTMGRALHALVWPESVRDHGPIVSGAFAFDGSEWHVRLEGRARSHERDGTPADPPALPGIEERDRYRLSLHDLLHSSGDAFAKAVALDAAGGMDIGQAAADLGFSVSRPSRRLSEVKDAEAARTALRTVRTTQETLAAEQARLAELHVQHEAALGARGRREVLALALDQAEARDAARAAHAARAAFPDALANVRDDDAETLRGLREKIRDAEATVAEAEAAAEDAQHRLDALGTHVGAHVGAEPPIAELHELLADIRETEGVLARKDEELAGLRLSESAAAESVGETSPPDRLAAVDASAIQALQAHALEAARLVALRKEHEAAQRIAASVLEEHPADPEGTAEAARALRDWLRSAGAAPAPATRWLALAGAAGSGLAAVGLALLGYPAGLALLLPAAILAYLYVRMGAGADGRATQAQERFRRAGGRPVEWTPSAVEAEVGRLDRDLANAQVVNAARSYAEVWADHLGDVDALAAKVAAEGAALTAALGVAPDVVGVQLFYTVRDLLAYQDAHRRRVAAEGAAAEARSRRQRVLDRAAAALSPFGLEAPSDAAALAARVAALEAAVKAADLARRDHEDANRERARAEKDRDEASAALAALLDRLGLDPAATDDAVVEAVRRAGPYREHQRAAADADAQAAAALARLHAHPAATPDLEELDAEALRARQAAADARAARADDLAREITTIETRVGDAQGGHELEKAAAELAAAHDALRDARSQAAAAAVGQVLADHVTRASRDSQVPPVVRRASVILGTITKHRYTLLFDPATGTFLARDTVLDRSFGLDQLSSGTRVQVLLSVRVAFVETLERGAQLPLVLDELLANSDDARAEAITQAVLTLCREGRQVLYFTSQADEVAKWRRVDADNADVDCAFFDLASPPAGDGAVDLDALPHPSLAHPVPTPDGLDHAAYRERLGVPPWTARDDLGSLHLWYAVDDPQTLHSVLSAGVTQLGPALAATHTGAADAIGLAHPNRLQVFADALSEWQAAWKQGRGEPVSRDVLEASGAISATFIDRVAALAADLQGDPQALLDALRNKTLERFRQSSADDLETYLLEHGILDTDDPLDADARWARVAARVRAACASDNPSLTEVRAFLGRIAAAGAGPSSAPGRPPAV